ncbi:unnamed protein product [Acanthosepion pharaonis]|uniref:AMP-dependent synthetase/ligase domain-containing protein n=1 Tax=Acanthosepion pharaonis TaxID=158019 RepID=A0A812ERY0_ACAPH|nr:unnamed protein product [Sepia pharaonis]
MCGGRQVNTNRSLECSQHCLHALYALKFTSISYSRHLGKKTFSPIFNEEKLNGPTMLKKSYFHQPGNIAYSYETIPERIQKLAEEKPDKIAMVMYHSKDERYEITRKELYDRSVKFARCLLKLGIKKGDPVAYCVSNCINWMTYDVGILMAGGISVHLLLGAADISKALDKCTFIILDAKENWDDLLSVAKIHPGGKITSDTCPSLKIAIAVSSDSRPANVLQASELIAEINAKDDGSFLEFPVLDPEDTAFICLTSGTTGTPKKIHHSHFNVLNCTATHDEDVNITCDDVIYNSRPMAYIGGYPFCYLNTGTRFVSGDTIFLSEPENFETVVDIWRKEGCTFVGLAPKELYDRSVKFARCLLKLGIKKGDRVAYCVSNCINWMTYDVGIMMAGGTSVHLLLGAADISKALDKCTFIILDAKEHWDDLLKDLYVKSLRFAQVLNKLGINKGDRVAYCVSNCIDWMVYDVGIMMAGAVSVHLLMGSADVKVTLSGCVMVILDSKERWNDFVGVAEILPGGKVSCNECPTLKLAMAVDPECRPDNALLASELMAEIEDAKYVKGPQLPVLDPDDIALVNQTSGTTGTPKKVCHTHFGIVNNLTIYNVISGFHADDVIYNNRPMAYTVGYPLNYIGTGTTTVTGDVRFLNDPANNDFLVGIWKKEGCTLVYMQPQIIKSIRDYGFRTKYLLSTGDTITEQMIRHSFLLTNAFCLIYGSTETLISTHRIFTQENITEHEKGMLGVPLPGMEMKIIDEKEEVVDIDFFSFFLYFFFFLSSFLSSSPCWAEGWFVKVNFFLFPFLLSLFLLSRDWD